MDELHRPSDLAPAKKEPAPSTTSATGQEKQANPPPAQLPAAAQEDVIPAEFEGEFGSRSYMTPS